MVMACGKRKSLEYIMLVYSMATNVVNTAQIDMWWNYQIARMDPAHRISHPHHAYISVLNESLQ